MKKNIKLLSIFLLIIFAFTSCDTDATYGILHNIANSEKKEKFEIRAATFDLITKSLYGVEVQDNIDTNGIYKYKTGINQKTKNIILNSSDYPQITSIYADNNNIYFNTEVNNVTEVKYLDASNLNTAAKDIEFEGTFVELTSNGFIIAKDDKHYIVYDLQAGTTTYTKAKATSFLSTTIVVDDELILQTVKKVGEKYEYNYYLNDGTSRELTKKNNKIVAAHKYDKNYYLVLDDGTLVLDDGTLSDFSKTVHEPVDDKKLSISTAKKLIVDNRYLFIIDQLKNVYSYDLKDLEKGYTLHSDGFANQIKYTSSIVEVFEYDTNKYYIATNNNGYYKLKITYASLNDAKMIQL